MKEKEKITDNIKIKIKDFLQYFVSREPGCEILINSFETAIDNYENKFLKSEYMGDAISCMSNIRVILEKLFSIGTPENKFGIEPIEIKFKHDFSLSMPNIDLKRVQKEIGITLKQILDSELKQEEKRKIGQDKMAIEFFLRNIIHFEPSSIEKCYNTVQEVYRSIINISHGTIVKLSDFYRYFTTIIKELYKIADCFLMFPSLEHFKAIDKWVEIPGSFKTIEGLIKNDYRKHQHFIEALTKAGTSIAHDKIYNILKDEYFSDKSLEEVSEAIIIDEGVKYPNWIPIFYLRKVAEVSSNAPKAGEIDFNEILTKIQSYLKIISEKNNPNLGLAAQLLNILDKNFAKILKKEEKIKILKLIDIFSIKDNQTIALETKSFIINCSSEWEEEYQATLFILLRFEIIDNMRDINTYLGYWYKDFLRELKAKVSPLIIFEALIQTFKDALEELSVTERGEFFYNSFIQASIHTPGDPQTYKIDKFLGHIYSFALEAILHDKDSTDLVFAKLNTKTLILNKINNIEEESEFPPFQQMELRLALEIKNTERIYNLLINEENFKNSLFRYDYYHLQAKGIKLLSKENQSEIANKIFGYIKKSIFKQQIFNEGYNTKSNRRYYLVSKLYPLKEYLYYNKRAETFFEGLLTYFKKENFNIEEEIENGRFYFDRIGGPVRTSVTGPGDTSGYSIEQIKEILEAENGINTLLNIIKHYSDNSGMLLYKIRRIGESDFAYNVAKCLVEVGIGEKHCLPILKGLKPIIEANPLKQIYAEYILQDFAYMKIESQEKIEEVLDFSIWLITKTEEIQSTCLPWFIKRLINDNTLTTSKRFMRVFNLIETCISKTRLDLKIYNDSFGIENFVLNDAKCIAVTSLLSFLRYSIENEKCNIKDKIQDKVKRLFEEIQEQENYILLFIYTNNLAPILNFMEDWFEENKERFFDKTSPNFFTAWKGFIEGIQPHKSLLKLREYYEYSVKKGYNSRFYNEALINHVIHYLVWKDFKPQDEIIKLILQNKELCDILFMRISKLSKENIEEGIEWIKKLFEVKIDLIETNNEAIKHNDLRFSSLLDFSELFGKKWIIEQAINLYKKGVECLPYFLWEKALPQFTSLLEENPDMQEAAIENIFLHMLKQPPINYYSDDFKDWPDGLLKLICKNPNNKTVILGLQHLNKEFILRIHNF